jgi:Mg-chelatase subunit ChlD
MGLDEKLFGLFYAAARRALGRSRQLPFDPASVAFDDVKTELGILACAVAERRVECSGVEGAGSVRAPRIELPKRMRLGNDPNLNVQCYAARVVFDAGVLRLGFTLPHPARCVTEQLLAALLVQPCVMALLDDELPGARRLFSPVHACELGMRPALATLPAAHAALEALAQVRLGGQFDRAASPHDAHTRRWLEQALAANVRDVSQLESSLHELSELVGHVELAPLLSFGAIDCACVEAAQKVASSARPNHAPHPGSERSVRARQQLRRIDLSQDHQEDNPLVHSFEKLHTADEYRGGRKQTDASDELAEHGAALDELELGELTRTNDAAGSYLRADVDIAGELIEVAETTTATAEQAHVYDEWDEQRQSYRRGWCNVYARTAAESVSQVTANAYVNEVLGQHRAELRAITAELSAVRNARAVRNRQNDGADIDLDALVERHAALRSGHSPPERLYMTRRRHDKELAVLLLVDVSLSSDAWVLGRRVLDVAKSALIILAEALHDHDVPTCVAAFSSETRKRCSFLMVKEFMQPWAAARRRLVSLEPHGYTRIGPALRHATALLARAPQRSKLLLLISDAKPTDYDRYEGRYGVADVQKALYEASPLGITTFALALDAKAGTHLPAMYRRGHFELLPRPDGLARALTGLYAELLH